MTVTRRLVHLVIGVLAIGTTLAAWAAEGDKQPIKIGIAGPHTGPQAAFGEQLWKGTKFAADEINAAGGIDGRKIELVKADDACEPKQAVSVANRLVDRDGVKAVIGHFCSSSTIPASETYDDADVLMITPASTNPKVTERGMPTIMRICGRDDQQGTVAADFIVKELTVEGERVKKVAILHDKDTYGRGLADATKARLAELGLKEVLYEGLTRGEKDFNALVTKIKSVDAQAVYFGGLHTEAGPLVRQMREQGLKAAFISGDGIVSNDFVTTAGGKKYVQGVYMTFGADPRQNKAGAKVVAAFRKQGFEPEGYTLYAYAAMQSVVASMRHLSEKGEKLGGRKMAAWLKANPVETAMGPKSWNKKGDLTTTDYVMYRWDAQGNYSQVTKQSE